MKKILIICLLSTFGCQKEENPMCEILRVELKEMYENNIDTFENNKVEYWTKMDELDCDRRQIKSNWIYIDSN
jgi:hypothetical protein